VDKILPLGQGYAKISPHHTAMEKYHAYTHQVKFHYLGRHHMLVERPLEQLMDLEK
jgi:hypothetical protein